MVRTPPPARPSLTTASSSITEVYGAGEPLLSCTGNNLGIVSLSAQIDHFRKRYRVIAMD